MVSKKIHPSISELAPLIKASLTEGRDVKITVTGNSMYPLLIGGLSRVVLERADSFKKYDVVLYQRQNGQYVLHRILSKKGSVLTIAGDNETVREYPIDESQCFARMKAFERNDKTYSVKSGWYIFYSRIWVWFFSLRSTMVKVLRFFAKIHRKISK